MDIFHYAPPECLMGSTLLSPDYIQIGVEPMRTMFLPEYSQQNTQSNLGPDFGLRTNKTLNTCHFGDLSPRIRS